MDMSTGALAPAGVAGKALTGEVFSALINLSGRRRFTSQRIVLYALLASQGQEDAAATAQEALALFRGAHKALLSEADGLPGVSARSCAKLTTARWAVTARSSPLPIWASAR